MKRCVGVLSVLLLILGLGSAMVFSAPIELNVWVGYAEVMPTLH